MRRLAAGLAVLGIVALLTACGGDKPRPPLSSGTTSHDATTAGTAVRTPTAQSDIIPFDWINYEAQGMRITLPPSFAAGRMGLVADTQLDAIIAQTPACAPLVNGIRALAHAYTFFALDPHGCAANSATNIVVGSQTGAGEVSALDALNASEQFLPRNFAIQKKEHVNLPHVSDAARMFAHVTGTTVNEVIYVVRFDTTYWTIAFTATGAMFDQLLPEFASIASTIEPRLAADGTPLP